eukprot:14988873-Alexandrium_andersonii.AAC.1
MPARSPKGPMLSTSGLVDSAGAEMSWPMGPGSTTADAEGPADCGGAADPSRCKVSGPEADGIRGIASQP